MSSINDGIDLFALYKIVSRLSQPWDQTDAYKMGLVDDNGVLIRRPQTPEEKGAYDPFDRFVFNLKRLLQKVGIKSSMGTIAVTAYLLKEDMDPANITDDQVDKITRMMSEEGEAANPPANNVGGGQIASRDIPLGRSRRRRNMLVNKPVEYQSQ